MALTPIDIENKKFDVRMRGYDKAQVKDFLGEMAEDSARLIAERNRLEEQMIEMRRKVDKAVQQEKRVQETILALHGLTERMKEDAMREGELIVREARLKAAQIMDEGREEAVQIEGQISQLRMERDTFEDRLRLLIDEHQRLLIQRRQDTDLRTPFQFRRARATVESEQ